MSEYHKKPHIVFQNTPDILDPSQKEGAQGRVGELIKHLMARAAHMALTGDKVVIGGETDQSFVDYLAVVTCQRPDYYRAKLGSPLFTRDILAAINPDQARGHLLNPYIQWRTVGEFSKKSGIPMAFTPHDRLLEGLAQTANNKFYFRTVAPELGIPLAPEQLIIPAGETDQIATAAVDLANRYGGSFSQADLSGGGVGNVDVKKTQGGYSSGKFGPQLNEAQLRLELSTWTQQMSQAGSENVIIAPYFEMKTSHTVSGFIPPDNHEKPFVYGVFTQVLDPKTHDYCGFEWPANDEYSAQYGEKMVSAAMNWFNHLKALGYVGPSDVDYMVGENPHYGRTLLASESNTRWDGFRFALQHGANVGGWNLRDLSGIRPDGSIGLKAIDHVASRNSSVNEIIEALGSKVPLLGLTNEQRGVVVMVPPRQNNGHYETALSVVGKDLEDAQQLYNVAEEILKP